MPKKRVFDAILLSLSIAYTIAKAISSFQFDGSLDSIEEDWNNYFAGE